MEVLPFVKAKNQNEIGTQSCLWKLINKNNLLSTVCLVCTVPKIRVPLSGIIMDVTHEKSLRRGMKQSIWPTLLKYNNDSEENTNLLI